jgi:hypothetical protein
MGLAESAGSIQSFSLEEMLFISHGKIGISDFNASISLLSIGKQSLQKTILCVFLIAA